MGGGGLVLGEVGLSGGVCSLRKAVGRGCFFLGGGKLCIYIVGRDGCLGRGSWYRREGRCLEEGN